MRLVKNYISDENVSRFEVLAAQCLQEAQIHIYAIKVSFDLSHKKYPLCEVSAINIVKQRHEFLEKRPLTHRPSRQTGDRAVPVLTTGRAAG